MAGRYYIKTFGCQMNEYDSARIADVLRGRLGLAQTDDPAAAELLLMNTCSVREKAQEKVYLAARGVARAQGSSGRRSSSASAAASPARRARRSRRARRVVDLVFGPQTLHRLPQMIAELRRRGARRWST